MKSTLTILLSLFIAISAYGQSKIPETHNNSGKINPGKLLQYYKRGFNKVSQKTYIQGNKILQQNYLQNSSLETKPGVDSLVIELKEDIAENWEYFYKEEFAYNGWGQVIRSILSWKVEDGPMKATEKCEYNYNSEGRMTQSFGYNMSDYGNQWEKDEKADNSYDANGNMTQFILSGYDGDSKKWFPYGKEEFTYDANGNMTQSIEFYNDGQWQPHYKIENSYNENGVLIQSTKYRSEDPQRWTPIRKLEYTLDEEENIIQSLYFNWDEENKKWSEGWMEEYTCDEHGNITQNSQCEWEGGQKEYFGKYEYNYDNSYAFSDLLIPIFDDEITIIEALDISVLFKHKLDNFVAYYRESEQGDWLPYFKGSLYYSEHNTSSVPQIDQGVTKIYPNPFSEYITISLPQNYRDITFELIDLQGRSIFMVTVTHNEKINLEKLKQGIYLYKLSGSGETIQEGKLVKK